MCDKAFLYFVSTSKIENDKAIAAAFYWFKTNKTCVTDSQIHLSQISYTYRVSIT